MDVEPSFPCINCGADTEIVWSKRGERLGWSCPVCKQRGYFKHEDARDKAVLAET